MRRRNLGDNRSSLLEVDEDDENGAASKQRKQKRKICQGVLALIAITFVSLFVLPINETFRRKDLVNLNPSAGPVELKEGNTDETIEGNINNNILVIDKIPRELSTLAPTFEQINQLRNKLNDIAINNLAPKVQNKPKSKLRDLLESFRTNVEERRAELEDQPDYNHPQYNKELERLSQDLEQIRDIPLKESIKLFVRPGHRRRVTDLIGGKPLNPQDSRQVIVEKTTTFVLNPTGADTRDYSLKPIQIRQDISVEAICDIPCIKCTNNCDSSGGEELTMENQIIRLEGLRPYSIAGSTRLDTFVPVPYFSWHDFGIMRPITGTALEDRTLLAAAFISNCQFEKRNNMVSFLISEFGSDRVHSFGGCVNNKIEEKPKGPNAKLDQLQQYKFSLAFENSETKDYVTEKFFGSLAAGSVPLYIGAPNIKFFAPDTTDYPYESDAVIRTKDFSDDPKQISKVLRALDSDLDLYKQLMTWKYNGYGDDYKALVDFSDVHSSCRSCIFIADEKRRRIGSNQYDIKMVKLDKPNYSTYLYVRERGTYGFTQIGFPQRPSKIIELVQAVLNRLSRRRINLWKDNDDKRPLKHLNRVYAIYTIAGRRPVLSDEDVQVLSANAEIEVIFV